jgi:hypothetical protein
LKIESTLSASGIRSILLPPAKQGSYPPSVRIALTVLLFAGLGMFFFPLVRPLRDIEPFWHRSYVMGIGGLVLAVLCLELRQAERTTVRNSDWLKSRELLFLTGLALLVIAADIHYSERIGLLAYPPYYDGAVYMWEAKYALCHLGTAVQHPSALRFLILGNRYPLWKALMAANFGIFGVGEWQSYGVRLWPIFILLMTVYWTVRRRAGWQAACAAAMFTALLPTVSPNFLSAALGKQIYPRGYLADLRPDILCAAFVALSVVLMIEHVHSFDEWTAILAGLSVSLAVLTKSTAIPAIALASGMAAMYVVFVNRQQLRKTLTLLLWGFLTITLLLTPWLLAGGFEQTVVYVKDVFTSQLSRYSDVRPTLRGRLSYYSYFLVRHMGWMTVVFAAATPAFVFLSFTKRRPVKACIHQPLAYLIIAATLFATVALGVLKNYFLGLPSYLMLWVYCWVWLTSWINPASGMAKRVYWGALVFAVLSTVVAGIQGVRNIHMWNGNEFVEGHQDRLALQQLALDLRHELSNKQSFVSMPAYGSPATLLFYMPSSEGDFPQATLANGTSGPTIEDFLRQMVEPAKAVLVYANGSKPRGWAEVGWVANQDFPYYRAIAAWVQRPGSAHHLLKSYDLYPDASGGRATIELYVRSD